MKKIMVKRLIYTNGNGISHIGGHEYDGRLTDDNILCAIHEVGKKLQLENFISTKSVGLKS